MEISPLKIFSGYTLNNRGTLYKTFFVSERIDLKIRRIIGAKNSEQDHIVYGGWVRSLGARANGQRNYSIILGWDFNFLAFGMLIRSKTVYENVDK